MKILIMGLCLFMGSWSAFAFAQPATMRNERPNVIILIGAPGSGKGTQAVQLSKELGIPHISTGEILRENMRKETALGKKAKSYMESGKLVPDEVVLEMLFERISNSDATKGFLLDGFPRTILQAEALEKHLSQNAHVSVLHIDVTDEAIVKRIAGRLSCTKCSNVHHKDFAPPVNDNQCDKCGAELVQRPDDKPETVKERLRVYHAQTEPLVQFYKQRHLLVDINGENPPAQVYEELMKVYRGRIAK